MMDAYEDRQFNRIATVVVVLILVAVTIITYFVEQKLNTSCEWWQEWGITQAGKYIAIWLVLAIPASTIATLGLKNIKKNMEKTEDG